MRTAPYDQKDGVRVWLSTGEQLQLVEHYDEDPEKQLALELCLHGLRVSEVVAVAPEHLRERDDQPDDDEPSWALTVPGIKSDQRETPVTAATVRLMRTLTNARGARRDEPAVTSSTRSVRRWVGRAAAQLEGEHADDVGPHDLRRTWATDTYWRLAAAGAGGDAELIVMSWGGWKRRDTFRENYLGTIPDDVARRFQRDAGLE